MYIYLHIPKTAGTAFRRVLSVAYGDDAIFWGYDAGTIDDLVKALNALRPEELEQFLVIASHQSFGLHSRIKPERRCLTLLRDPVDRFVSDFYFIQGDEVRPRNAVFDGREGIGMAEYLQAGLSTIDNGLVRSISGTCVGRPPGQVGRDDLETAKQNLSSHFAAFGFSEDFAECVVLFRRKLGWKRAPFYRRENVTKNRVSVADIPADDLAIIKTYFELDIELYQYAQQLYQEEVASLGPDFRGEVDDYRAAIDDVNGLLEQQGAELLMKKDASDRLAGELKSILDTRSHRTASKIAEAMTSIKRRVTPPKREY